MNKHKTKVIAIRVTQEQYEGLMCLKGDVKMGNYLYLSLLPTLNAGVAELNAERKKAEAKAKRLAKKEASHGLQS
jgi:hypothetical protein